MDRGLPVDFWFCTPDQAFQENRRLVESEREGQIFAESIDTQYGYLTPYLREWASNPLLRLIVIDYPILEKLPLQGLCVDLVELFQESNIPVSWLMLESGNPSTEPPTKEFLLKALIFQIIQLPQFPQEVNFIAPSYDNDDEVSLLEFLTSAIAKIENIVIVIDSSLLRCARPSYGDVIVHSWISTLLGISRCEHWRSDKGIYPPGGGVKVVFAAYDCEPLQLQPTQPDYEGHWLYVDTTKSITCPPPRPSQLRGRLTRIRQLGRVVRAYIDSIEERSSKKISEQPLARLYPDGADVPSFEPIELTAHVESPTSSNSKQPSAPPSREKVAESIVTIIQNYSTFDGIRPPIVPTSATQAPRSQLSATFSQRSEAQPATPQPSSSRTECISHKAVASVSRFELFDNQEPLGDA